MALSVEQLIGYKIPEEIIASWRRRNVHTLLPLQAAALTETNYLKGANLVVFAPTSSGKTFIAESASARVLTEQREVVYLVPTRALAEEKVKELRHLFEPLGFRVLVATSERPETDPFVQQGKFDLLVAVYEKMRAYLVSHPEMLSRIGLIVADELHMLGDPSRGDVLDIVLSKIRSAPYKVQIIGLSATLADAASLASWLDAELLNFPRRPVELREGVFNLEDGIFYYRLFNSRSEGNEKLAEPPGFPEGVEPEEIYRQGLLHLVRYLVMERKEQVLVFVPTRGMSRSLALELSRDISLPAVDSLIEQLNMYEESYSRNVLTETLTAGVAFHNADLTRDLRGLIEEAYDSGMIRVLFSTTTLGQGVNLTGRNVINVHQMVATEEWSGEYTFVPLTRQRFCNQGGRSARFARSKEFGRSILIAINRAEAERLFDFYLCGDLEGTAPPLENKKLEKYVVDLVATGPFNSRKKVMDFFFETFSGTRHWQSEAHKKKIASRLSSAIEYCLNKGLITEDETGALSCTGVGEVMALKGIQPLTVLRFCERVDEWRAQRRVPHDLELLLAVSFTPDAAEFPLSLNRQERNLNPYLSEINKRLASGNIPLDSMKRFLTSKKGINSGELRSLKRTILLADWVITDIPTIEIEHKYHTLAGTIRRLGLHYNWLMQSLADIAGTIGGERELMMRIHILAEKLVYGTDEKGLGIARLRVDGISRTYIARLVREGFDSAEAIASVEDCSLLSPYLPPHLAQELVYAAKAFLEMKRPVKPVKKQKTVPVTKSPKPEGEQGAAPPVVKPAPGKEKSVSLPRLVIDTDEPGIITMDGERITLTPLPYRLLLLLAERGKRGATYREIDEILWPDAKVEQQQISAHKSTLIKAFAKVLGTRKAKKLIETRSGFGLILLLDSCEIEIKKS